MTRNVVYKCCTFKRQYACLNAHGSQAGKFGYHKDFSLDFNLLTELPSKLNLLANFGCGDNKTGFFFLLFSNPWPTTTCGYSLIYLTMKGAHSHLLCSHGHGSAAKVEGASHFWEEKMDSWHVFYIHVLNLIQDCTLYTCLFPIGLFS